MSRRKAQHDVRVDGVGAGILRDIGPQLVDETDAAALMAGCVQEHAALLGGQHSQCQTQLYAAVAAERAQGVTGQTLGVKADENVVAVADVADDHGHVHVTGGSFERADVRRGRRASAGAREPLRRVIMRPPFTHGHVSGKLPHDGCRPILWFVAPGRVEIAVGSRSRRSTTAKCWCARLFSGISSGTELLAYRGELDPDLAVDETIGALGGTFRYPFRYGYSCVGVVEESRCRAVADGTMVFAFQPHQDRVRGRRRATVIELGVGAARAATLFPLVETALQITLDAGPILGETVVVLRARRRRRATALLLQRAGARVLAVEPRPWRRDAIAARRDGGGARASCLRTLDAAGRRRAARGRGRRGTPTPSPGPAACWPTRAPLLVASWYGTKEVTLPLGEEFHRRRLTIRSTQVSTIPARLGDRWTVTAARRSAVVDLLDELPLDRAGDAHVRRSSSRRRPTPRSTPDQQGLIHAALGYA